MAISRFAGFKSKTPTKLCILSCCILAIVLLKYKVSIGTSSFIQWNSGVSAVISNVDLGKVRAGESHDFQYKIVNDSARPVKFLGARMSCTCTSLEGLPKTLPGGKAIVIRAKFSPSRTQRDRYIGNITIFTDDPRKYELRLDFEATVVAPDGPTMSNRSQNSASLAEVGSG